MAHDECGTMTSSQEVKECARRKMNLETLSSVSGIVFPLM